MTNQMPEKLLYALGGRMTNVDIFQQIRHAVQIRLVDA